MRQERRQDAIRLKNYEKANGLDFRRLAELADASVGVTFDTVLRRALKGVTDEAELARASILPATPDWLTIDDACKVLCVTPHTFAGQVHRHPTALYYGIRAKSRSTLKTLEKNGKGARGCGLLLYRPDCEKVAEIKRECGIGFVAALKVFCAMSEGRLK